MIHIKLGGVNGQRDERAGCESDFHYGFRCHEPTLLAREVGSDGNYGQVALAALATSRNQAQLCPELGVKQDLYLRLRSLLDFGRLPWSYLAIT